MIFRILALIVGTILVPHMMLSQVHDNTNPIAPRQGDIGVRHATYESPHVGRNAVVTVNEALAPFYHGVASGDPSPNGVVLWTRVTPTDMNSVEVGWRVARDPEMTQIVTQGTATAGSADDYHVKVQVESALQPGTTYYYDFIALGKRSMVGRTKTLPPAGASHIRIAVVSCSNYPAGFFNAYAAIAARNDIDAVIHLGDYIYEYDADSTSYGGRIGIQLGRQNDPVNETVSLTDYRTRYSQYRLDPDLQELHRQHPFIHVWDDHESANNSYTGGAQNHQANEGSWAERLAVSKRVCLEWMPTRLRGTDPIYRSFAYGDLVDLFMIDTRLDGRDKQIENVGPAAPQASFDSLNSPTRRMMSDAQFNWLTTGLERSQATWKLIGNQVLFSPVTTNPIDTAFLFEAVGPLFTLFLRPQLPTLQNLMTSGFDGDTWSNYPAQRAALVNFLQMASVNNVVIATGDFHSTYVFDVPYSKLGTRRPIAVEFVSPSITSANFDDSFASIPTVAPIATPLLETLSRTLHNNNPSLKQLDLVRHGYVVLDFTAQAVQGDAFFVDTLFVRNRSERFGFGWRRDVSSDSLRRVATPAPGKAVQDRPAPSLPTSVVQSSFVPTVLAVAPNPASTLVTLTWSNPIESAVSIDIIDAAGRMYASFSDPFSTAGLRSTVFDVASLPNGMYYLRLNGRDGQRVHPLVIQR